MNYFTTLTILFCCVGHSLCGFPYVVAGKNLPYIKAMKACRSMGLHLVKIENADENTKLYKFVKKKNLGTYWIDANDIVKEGTWMYADGGGIKFTQWNKGSPNNDDNEDCAHGLYFKDANWNDVNCNSKNTAICEERKVKEKKINHIKGNKTYKEALKSCKLIGMSIIRISDNITNELLYNMSIKLKTGNYWINANDIKIEGNFTYDNNQPARYSQWNAGEPDNLGDEDCVQGLVDSGGKWKDISCDSRNAVFCFKHDNPPLTTGNLKIVARNVSYIGALKACDNKGLKLLQIDNEVDNKLVFDWATKAKSGHYWIDANDREIENTFVHEDGTVLSFMKWQKGVSNNKKNIDCVHGLQHSKGFWNVVSCDAKITAICIKPTLKMSSNKKV